MNKESNLYKATKFNDLREMLSNSVKLYPEHIAFIIKNKLNNKLSYTKITYSRVSK